MTKSNDALQLSSTSTTSLTSPPLLIQVPVSVTHPIVQNNRANDVITALNRTKTAEGFFSGIRWSFKKQSYTRTEQNQITSLQRLFNLCIGDILDFDLKASFLGMNDKFDAPSKNINDINEIINVKISPELREQTNSIIAVIRDFITKRNNRNMFINGYTNDPINMFCCFLIKATFSISQESCNTIEGVEKVIIKTSSLLALLNHVLSENTFPNEGKDKGSIYQTFHFVGKYLKSMQSTAQKEKYKISSKDNFREINQNSKQALFFLTEYLITITKSNPLTLERLNITRCITEKGQIEKYVDKLVMPFLEPLIRSISLSENENRRFLEEKSEQRKEAILIPEITSIISSSDKKLSAIHNLIKESPDLQHNISKLYHIAYVYMQLIKEQEEAEMLAGKIGDVGVYAVLRNQTFSLIQDTLSIQQEILTITNQILSNFEQNYDKTINLKGKIPEWSDNYYKSINIFNDLQRSMSLSTKAAYSISSHMSSIPAEVEVESAKNQMKNFINQRNETNHKIALLMGKELPREDHLNNPGLQQKSIPNQIAALSLQSASVPNSSFKTLTAEKLSVEESKNR